MADISRAEVATLIQEAYADVLLDGAREASTALSAFPTVSMGTKLTHLPVLATLPEAGWVSESATESSGVKPTSQATWQDRTLVAEEIAVILPVHEHVIDDATTALLSELASLGGQAIGKKLDQAVFFGTDKPASWVSDDLLSAAVAASQDVTVVSGDANSSDIVGAVNQVAESIAVAGYSPDTMVASLAMRYQVANLRDANGNPIFRDESFAGFRTFFNRNGAWAPASAVAIVADSSKVRIGVRQDIQVKLLDQATVGSINLAERDMVAIRLKARFAYVLGNGATPAGDSQTPVGAVLPASGS
jgi:HK97 family phage major capsid protein